MMLSSSSSSSANNNNKLSRPLPPLLADAAAKAARVTRQQQQEQQQSSNNDINFGKKSENDRRRKIAAKCLEMEEMLEARGSVSKFIHANKFIKSRKSLRMLVCFSMNSHSPSEIDSKVSEFRTLLLSQSSLSVSAAANPLAARLFANNKSQEKPGNG